MSTQSKNPVYRQTEVSFKQLTDSNQSSVDDMAVIRGHGWVQTESSQYLVNLLLFTELARASLMERDVRWRTRGKTACISYKESLTPVISH